MSRRRIHVGEDEIIRRLEAGESQRAVARDHLLNPVTVGAIARRAGIRYPQAQKSAETRRGRVLRQPEASFQAQVVQAAQLAGWLVYHAWRSEHSAAGFPDLVLVRPPRVVFAELKADDGRLMPAQEVWLAALRACPGVEAGVWRPRDWAALVEVLR